LQSNAERRRTKVPGLVPIKSGVTKHKVAIFS
jgi:hypothetical protein